MSARLEACDACVRRTWLLARLAGGLEIIWRRRRPLREVLALSDDDLLQGVAGNEASAIAAELTAVDPDRERARALVAGIVLVCRHSATYPSRLLDDRSHPAVLHLAASGGTGLDRLQTYVGSTGRPPAVAIVGTRKASPEGLEIARALGRGLSAAGVTVVSGMALGIDSAAHAGAVEGGGPTVAVLGGGADVAYPASRRSLHRALVADHLVVSEMPPGSPVRRWCFPARNRIIAALADVTIVVEAARRSGSLITAELALDLGRDVAAVPGPVLSWRSDGTNALLRDGATLIRDARDALDLVLGVEADALDGMAVQGGVMAAAPSQLALMAPALTPTQRRLLTAVGEGRGSVADLATGPQDAGAVRSMLVGLELEGLIRRAPGGRWIRVLDGERRELRGQ
jgi:DNA processing protein